MTSLAHIWNRQKVLDWTDECCPFGLTFQFSLCYKGTCSRMHLFKNVCHGMATSAYFRQLAVIPIRFSPFYATPCHATLGRFFCWRQGAKHATVGFRFCGEKFFPALNFWKLSFHFISRELPKCYGTEKWMAPRSLCLSLKTGTFCLNLYFQIPLFWPWQLCSLFSYTAAASLMVTGDDSWDWNRRLEGLDRTDHLSV